MSYPLEEGLSPLKEVAGKLIIFLKELTRYTSINGYNSESTYESYYSYPSDSTTIFSKGLKYFLQNFEELCYIFTLGKYTRISDETFNKKASWDLFSVTNISFEDDDFHILILKNFQAFYGKLLGKPEYSRLYRAIKTNKKRDGVTDISKFWDERFGNINTLGDFIREQEELQKNPQLAVPTGGYRRKRSGSRSGKKRSSHKRSGKKSKKARKTRRN